MKLIELQKQEQEDGQFIWSQSEFELIEIDKETAKKALSGYAVYYLKENNTLDYTTWWTEHLINGFPKVHHLPESQQYFMKPDSWQSYSKNPDNLVRIN